MKIQTSIRVEENTYQNAKQILQELGLSYSQAINIFNSLIVKNRGLPFDVKLPNNETIEAIKEYEKGIGRRFNTTEELFRDLDE
jgi:DNA-damage-inducible protein J